MGDKSKIEWTEATWNPIVGCSVVSPGCTNCYAMKMAARIEAMAIGQTTKHGSPGLATTHYAGTTQSSKAGPVWTGKLARAPEKTLLQPLSWQRPRTIFVNSMGDLFHESAPEEWIDQVFAVMALASQHTFQVLTKRAERMRDFMTRMTAMQARLLGNDICSPELVDHFPHMAGAFGHPSVDPEIWPLPNVWLGVSAEDQKRADERIPHLLQTPAAVRFVSAEPLIGPINLSQAGLEVYLNGLDDPITTNLNWIIVGGESGPNARPMHPDWARSIRDQCQAAGVPFFFKQWGEHAPNGSGRYSMIKVGKRAAGRLLDGREHNEMPERANG